MLCDRLIEQDKTGSWQMFRRRSKSTANSAPAQTPAAARSSGSRPSIFERILLVVDGSEPSLAAADFGVRLALQAGSQVTAIYVIDTATMDYLMQMKILVTDERQEFERDLESTGRRYLDYVSAVAANSGLQIETRLERGSFHQTVLQVAREIGVDAIVVGGWRRTITRKDASSVERQLILDEAEFPVIVVKAESRRG
jgi:nucleotide-binding universal stress UspA family protein